MELNQIKDYKLLLDEFISLFRDIKEIFSINLNDAFKMNNINKIKTSKLIKDTEIVLSIYNNDINKILDLKSFSEDNNISLKDNLFVKYTIEYEKLILNKIIINNEIENEILKGHFIKSIDKKKIFKEKKEHEVKRLSNFIKKCQDISFSEILVEIGCGKSYLTDALLTTENNNKLLYIGVDMNKKVFMRIN